MQLAVDLSYGLLYNEPCDNKSNQWSLGMIGYATLLRFVVDLLNNIALATSCTTNPQQIKVMESDTNYVNVNTSCKQGEKRQESHGGQCSPSLNFSLSENVLLDRKFSSKNTKFGPENAPFEGGGISGQN